MSARPLSDARFRSAIVAVPLVISLLLAGFTAFTRAHPRQQGGFCTTYTLVLLDVVRATSGNGFEVTPAQALALLEHLDANRLRAVAPTDLRKPTKVLADKLPGVKRALQGLPANAKVLDVVPSDVIAAIAAVVTEFQKRCG